MVASTFKFGLRQGLTPFAAMMSSTVRATTGAGVNRSDSPLCTQTTASTVPDSSMSIAIWVTMPVHCAHTRVGLAEHQRWASEKYWAALEADDHALLDTQLEFETNQPHHNRIFRKRCNIPGANTRILLSEYWAQTIKFSRSHETCLNENTFQQSEMKGNLNVDERFEMEIRSWVPSRPIYIVVTSSYNRWTGHSHHWKIRRNTGMARWTTLNGWGLFS